MHPHFLLDDLVINLGVKCIRNESCSDTLNLMRACFSFGKYRRSCRLNSYDLNFRVLLFRYSPVPVSVPPVPTPATKISTFPSVSFQISGPVVASCAAGLAGFYKLSRMKLFGISFASSSAFAMAPFIPLAPSVRTISAPYAFRMFLLSTLMVSGMVRIVCISLCSCDGCKSDSCITGCWFNDD